MLETRCLVPPGCEATAVASVGAEMDDIVAAIVKCWEVLWYCMYAESSKGLSESLCVLSTGQRIVASGQRRV